MPFMWSTLVAAVLILVAAPASPDGVMPFDNGHGGDLVIRMSQTVEP